ncbi:MAG: HAMP domain-containing histidine kinase [Lachnospiraceae bacterium]|nr:HAMP domain-containing histidine kinase [Lachnospiraceae bacterium]
MKKSTFSSPSIESETIEKLSAQLIQTTQALYLANEQLKREQQQKGQMLANISHDLRAPITAIRGCIDYLNSGHVLSEEDLKSSLQLIDRRTRTLECLIQDMYFLFSVEDMSRDFEFTTVEAAPFLEEYFYDNLFDSRYDDREMQLELSPDLNCRISVDIQKFIRVLDNLFTNAAKYSEPGASIALSAQTVPSHDKDTVLLIEVSDTGIGIPQEALAHIFDRTYTVSSARTPASATGSGLGLSIVNTIVQRHGGNITCKSKEGAGSTFSITLPIIST